MTKAFHRHGWSPQHLWLAALLAAVGVLVTLPAWIDIAHVVYQDTESSHVWLVFPVVAWLVWVRRARLRHCRQRRTFIGPVLVLIGWVMSAWGFRNAVQSFFHGGAVVVVVGCILTVLGWDILFRFLPAFVALVFLVPIPGFIRAQIAIPLQTATAAATQAILEVFGQSVERAGNSLYVNGQEVDVIAACNGLRLVFPLVLVCYAFAFGEALKNYVRFIIVLASPLSAIACNVIRMVPTVWLYGAYGNEKDSFAHVFHDIAGWAMLVPAFLMLMAIIRVLRWAMIPVQPYTLANEGA